MLELSEVRTAFGNLSDLKPLGIRSGQKDVLSGRQGTERIALKLIKPAAQDADRMLREIEAAARLDSDFVPKVLEHGSRAISGQDRIYLIEQFIEGESLRAALQTNPTPCLPFVLSLASALLFACRDFENAQLVHRDVKPENIIVGTDGKVWIIDFGIVRILDQESLTATSLHFGPCTPGYGAPEQVRNLKPKIDVRADLFSVGIVLYEALFGENPHLAGKRDVLEVIRSMEQADLHRLVNVDAELADFIAALTARFPTRRPRSAQDALDWFQPIRARLNTPAD